jgi:hypothetical protein
MLLQQFIGVNQSKFDNLKQQFGLDDLLLTILVVGYLTKYRNKPEYYLILKKGGTWINKIMS